MYTHRFARIGFSVLAAIFFLLSTVASAYTQSNNQVLLPFIQQGDGQFGEVAGHGHGGGEPEARPTIVLVHGAWADGTGWQEVIKRLVRKDYPVIAVQNPLTTLVDDVETTKRVIDAQTGPVIVVGHSYGGAVMTAAAAGNPNVKALVYIAAFAPAAGEPVGAWLGLYPTELGTSLVPDAAGFLYLDRTRFREIFAADVDRPTLQVMAAAQKPIFGGIFAESPTAAAWETIPAWYMVAKNDRALHPDLERYYANRMGATVVEISSSHVPFISQPDEVVKLIEQAARATD